MKGYSRTSRAVSSVGSVLFCAVSFRRSSIKYRIALGMTARMGIFLVRSDFCSLQTRSVSFVVLGVMSTMIRSGRNWLALIMARYDVFAWSIR